MSHLTIETLIAEIQERKRKDLESLGKELSGAKDSMKQKMDASIKEMRDRFANEAKLKSEKESARIVEAARLQAKKILFEAINTNLGSAFTVIKEKLKDYAKTLQYKKTLETMVNVSKKKLGQDIVVHCNEGDRALLKELNVTVGSPIQTLGGIVAENKKGTIELDLTFEELLRTREDEVKSRLMEKVL